MEIDFAQLEFVDRFLRKMVLATEARFKTLMPFVITSLFRIGDPGVHGQLPVRGVDISCSDDSRGTRIAHWVNSRYIYDPHRPHMQCCIYHDVGFGKHLHFQVHPNTIERGIEV